MSGTPTGGLDAAVGNQRSMEAAARRESAGVKELQPERAVRLTQHST